MSWNYLPFLEDIRLSCRRVARYTQGLTYEQFLADDKTYDAVLRHLAIIGEAVKQIPDPVRQQYPTVEWRKIARFRDLVIHHYFGIDNQIVWDVVENKVPELLALLDTETPQTFEEDTALP